MSDSLGKLLVSQLVLGQVHQHTLITLDPRPLPVPKDDLLFHILGDQRGALLDHWMRMCLKEVDDGGGANALC